MTEGQISAAVRAARDFDESQGRYTDIDWRTKYARELARAMLTAAEQEANSHLALPGPRLDIE